MRKTRLTVPEILNQLEVFYGKQEPCWPSDPYLFLLWWYCGYPASDASCSEGWKELTGRIGTVPDAILAAHPDKLTAALKPGGMFPELRAERMKEVTARIKNEFGGDLRASLAGPTTKVRKVLKSFPSIADPGADRIPAFRRNPACGGRAFKLHGRTGAHSDRTRGKELQRKLPCGPAHD